MKQYAGVCFQVRDFAASALWKGTTTVPVLFDPRPADPFNVASVDPRATAEAAAMPGVAPGDSLVILGTTYLVREVETISEIVRLKLEKQ